MQKNQSGKFVYFISWLSLIVFAENFVFFSSTRLESLESSSFNLQIPF